MNLLDLGILIALVLVCLRGYYRGLFQELSVIVGLLGGIVIAAHLYLRIANVLSQWIKNPLYSQILGFSVILIAVYWLTRFLGHLLQRVLVILYLERLDRLLGGLFALVKGMLILGFVLTALHLVVPKDSRLLRESRAAPYLEGFYSQALNLLPPEFIEQLKQQIMAWQERWDQPGIPGDSSEKSAKPSEELNEPLEESD
jgi:membrane protein required for colicin V production